MCPQHRSMIADLGHDVSACTVSEDGISFALLIDAMYAPEPPLTTDCIDVLSGKWNVLHLFLCCVACHEAGCHVGRRKLQENEPTQIIQMPVCTYVTTELQHKYSMKRLHDSCSRFISKISLDIENLLRWHILGSKFGYKEALEHCDMFTENGQFDAINRWVCMTIHITYSI